MMLEAEYEAYFDQDADKDSKEYKIAAAKLEIAGEQIKASKLAEFKGIKVDDPQELQKSIEDSKKELAKSWEISFTELTKNPLKVSQKIALDDKSEVEVDFTPEDNKKYTDLMGLYLLHNDLKPSAENAQKARDYATSEIVRERWTDIVKGILEKDRKTQWEAYQKTRNNNRPLTAQPISADGKKSQDQQILEMLETGETYVPNK
jgi:hypothetical protein